MFLRASKDKPPRSKGKYDRRTDNPQFEIQLRASAGPRQVIVALREWDSQAARDGRHADPVLLQRVGVDDFRPLQPDSVVRTVEQRAGAAGGVVQHVVTLTLDPGTAAVVPAFMRPDKQAEFALRVYCTDDVQLTEVDKPVNALKYR